MRFKLSAQITGKLTPNNYSDDSLVNVSVEREMSAFAGTPLSELSSGDIVGLRERFRIMIDQMNSQVEDELAVLQQKAYLRERTEANDSTRENMAL